MKNRLLIIASITVISLIFTGCGVSTSQAISTPIKSTQQNVVFKFKNGFENDNLDKSAILKKIAAVIEDLSNYKKKDYFSGTIRNKVGTFATTGINSINVTFKRAEYYRTGSIGSTYTEYKIPYIITTKKDYMYFNLKYPTSKQSATGKNGLNLPIEPIASEKQIQHEFDNIFNKLSKAKISITLSHEIKGSINSKYSVDSIYGNFERLFGSYKSDKTGKIIKNTYNFEINNIRTPLYVNVYPYRNGSKIIYSTMIPYTIDSKDEITINTSIINSIHKMVINTVND